MADCTKKVIDVFMTNEYDEEGGYTHNGLDEVWQTAVWSVEVHEQDTVTVCNASTTWIMSSFRNWGPELEVGDLVRVGNLSSSTYSDYLTILEKRPVRRIGSSMHGAGTSTAQDLYFVDKENTAGNGDTGGSVQTNSSNLSTPIGDSNNTLANFGGTNTTPWDYVNGYSIGGSGGLANVPPVEDLVDTPTMRYMCYRVNHAINATLPPTSLYTDHIATPTNTLIERRANLLLPETATGPQNWPNHLTATQEALMKRRVFPLYKVRRPAAELKVKLDIGVKAVHWLKLCGISLVNKRHAGFECTHELHTDDWVALHVREISGEVISNNPAANGAFTVIHAGHDKEMTTGTVDAREWDPQGLVTHIFEQPRTDLRSLTVSVVDRFGQAAHLGRAHLWFKLCVSHG